MATKSLRSTTRQAPPPPAPPPPPRKASVTSAQLRRVAQADASNPPAIQTPTKVPHLVVNFRLSAQLVEALAIAAEENNTTQKVLFARALKAAGYPVLPVDLEDRRPRRR